MPVSVAQLWHRRLENRRSLVRTSGSAIILQGLMIVIATGFIPLSPMSNFSTIVIWESSQWPGKNVLWRTPGKHEYGHWLPRYNWNKIENDVTHHTVNQCFSKQIKLSWRKEKSLTTIQD